MKTLFKNIGVLFALLITLTTFSFSDNNATPQLINNIDSRFLIEGKKLIDPRSVQKIDEIGNELFSKTGVNIYVYAKDFYPINEFESIKAKHTYIKGLEDDIVAKLDSPYVLLSMAVKEKHVNLLSSSDVSPMVDKDDILDNFIIPLLASKDKNTPYSKVSAAILNGYAEVADRVAEVKGLKLESSIGSGNTNFTSVWKVFMYFIVITGLLAYTYAVLRARKR
ncbi:MAG: hypothetical protein K0U38_07030 [Epsilonproteobacteria bacterium]|nr:hypothetical protein [Campylobacterota bacterium]